MCTSKQSSKKRHHRSKRKSKVLLLNNEPNVELYDLIDSLITSYNQALSFACKSIFSIDINSDQVAPESSSEGSSLLQLSSRSLFLPGQIPVFDMFLTEALQVVAKTKSHLYTVITPFSLICTKNHLTSSDIIMPREEPLNASFYNNDNRKSVKSFLITEVQYKLLDGTDVESLMFWIDNGMTGKFYLTPINTLKQNQNINGHDPLITFLGTTDLKTSNQEDSQSGYLHPSITADDFDSKTSSPKVINPNLWIPNFVSTCNFHYFYENTQSRHEWELQFINICQLLVKLMAPLVPKHSSCEKLLRNKTRLMFRHLELALQPFFPSCRIKPIKLKNIKEGISRMLFRLQFQEGLWIIPLLQIKGQVCFVVTFDPYRPIARLKNCYLYWKIKPPPSTALAWSSENVLMLDFLIPYEHFLFDLNSDLYAACLNINEELNLIRWTLWYSVQIFLTNSQFEMFINGSFDVLWDEIMACGQDPETILKENAKRFTVKMFFLDSNLYEPTLTHGSTILNKGHIVAVHKYLLNTVLQIQVDTLAISLLPSPPISVSEHLLQTRSKRFNDFKKIMHESGAQFITEPVAPHLIPFQLTVPIFLDNVTPFEPIQVRQFTDSGCLNER